MSDPREAADGAAAEIVATLVDEGSLTERGMTAAFWRLAISEIVFNAIVRVVPAPREGQGR